VPPPQPGGSLSGHPWPSRSTAVPLGDPGDGVFSHTQMGRRNRLLFQTTLGPPRVRFLLSLGDPPSDPDFSHSNSLSFGPGPTLRTGTFLGLGGSGGARDSERTAWGSSVPSSAVSGLPASRWVLVSRLRAPWRSEWTGRQRRRLREDI
jgi:hypothetical protein